MIKVALPNKGQLFEPTMALLSACGYKVGKSLRSLSTLDSDNGVEFFFLRPSDIPLYVSNGILDAGITGKDFVAEKGVTPTCLVDLNYGASKLCAAVPASSPVQDLAGIKNLRIATSFPNIVTGFFGGHPSLIELEGAVEISIKLGIADAVVDIVETGTTLVQAGLRIIGTPLFESCSALFAHPGRETAPEVQVMRSRIEGRLLAQEYMMVEYDVPKTLLEKACELTPGLESPTVTSLAKPAWFSVKSMIRKKEAQKLLDALSVLGCKGILLTAIDSVRI
jgi:ATP phosphoribosyltransferase